MMKKGKPFPELYSRFILFLFLCCCSIPVAAQFPKIHCGITASPAIKFPFFPSGNDVYHVWGNVGLGLTTIVEGTEENDLSFSLKTGFGIDFSKYKAPGYRTLIMDRGNLFLNPEILFPTRSPRLKIAGGFGVDINGYFLAQMDQNSEDLSAGDRQKIENARRKALPFLSAGLQYDLKNSFMLHVFLRQMLMDAFSGAVVLTFDGPDGPTQMKLNQAPTILGFGIAYFF